MSHSLISQRLSVPLAFLLLWCAFGIRAGADTVFTNVTITPTTRNAFGGDIAFNATIVDKEVGLYEVFASIFRNGVYMDNVPMYHSGDAYGNSYHLPTNPNNAAFTWTVRITAINNLGNNTNAPDLIVTQDGDPGVTITNRTVSPTHLNAFGGNITFRADVVDNPVGLYSVYASLFRNGVYYDGVTLTNAGGDTYAYTYHLPTNPTDAAFTWTIRLSAISTLGNSATAPDLSVTQDGDPGVVITEESVTPQTLNAFGGNITVRANVMDNPVGIYSVDVFLWRNGVYYDSIPMYPNGGDVYTGVYTLPMNNTMADFAWTVRLSAISTMGNRTFAPDVTVTQRGRYPTVVSGVLTLQEDTRQAQPVTFDFRPTDNGIAYTQTVTPGSDGSFTLTNVPWGSYNLAIKGYKWLQVVLLLDTTNGSVTGLTALLLGGDANNDNQVDIGDFGILVNAYGGDASLPGSGYDVRADFNDDGIVDIGDFGILINNFGSIGDP